MSSKATQQRVNSINQVKADAERITRERLIAAGVVFPQKKQPAPAEQPKTN